MVLLFEGSKLKRFPLDVGHYMYKMYIEEFQSTLILMLVETGQRKGVLINGSMGNY